jgi:hypothetical protein
MIRPGSVNEALEPLRLGRKLDRYRDTARMVLDPWLVEAALARLGDRRLALAEQQLVVVATPHAFEGAMTGLVWRLPHKISKNARNTGAGLING